jgi:glyoxylase-like metal-dependent hydrolase (beta-lactamase superfamily II)
MQTIDLPTLCAWLEQGEPLAVLDVRPAAERAEWFIPGSMHADRYLALKAGDPAALDGIDLPVDVPIVTVCAAGRMSLVAANLLAARGHRVYSLVGGMQAWSMAWNVAALPTLPSGAQILQIRRTGKGCLSYLIGAGGAAIVIDAALDSAVYQTLAAQHGWQITAVVDSHIHADHLSRARQLAAQVGATLYLPAQERVHFPFTALHDGAQIAIGTSQIAVLHTPGHTLESMCYLLDEQALFTGDSLFLAAVGRPDLEASAEGARTRAQLLYDSLQRLLALPPTTFVLPGHTSTPVAFDGRPLVATLAEVQAAIPRLQLAQADFVTALLARLPATPPNHQQIVALNEAGAVLPSDPASLEAGANRCAIA